MVPATRGGRTGNLICSEFRVGRSSRRRGSGRLCPLRRGIDVMPYFENKLFGNNIQSTVHKGQRISSVHVADFIIIYLVIRPVLAIYVSQKLQAYNHKAG